MISQLRRPTTAERIGQFVHDALKGLANASTPEGRHRVLVDLSHRIAAANAERAKLSAEERELEARIERREAAKWEAYRMLGGVL